MTTTNLFTAAALLLAAFPAYADPEQAPAAAEAQAPDIVTVTTTTTTATQDNSKPKLTVNPTGLILMDGALYTSNDKDLFPDGAAIPDVRIGVKATYGNWQGKVDVGFAFGKVTLKDILFRYTWTPSSSIQFGYFIHHFGLQNATSSTMKISMEEPMVNEALNNPRLLGAMYVFNHNQYFASASLYAESAAMTHNSNQLGKTGYGGITRLAWRPLRGGAEYGGNMVQAGISFQAGSPQYNDDKKLNHHCYTVSANFPTRVAKVQAVGTTVDDVTGMFRFTPELLLAHGPLALEAQYYYMQLSRKHDLPTYRTYGAYGMLRWLAKGGDYRYSHADAGIATPSPKSLELVLMYGYLNTTSAKAGIRGGRANDISLTANWYINKYMIWRARAGYTHRFDRFDDPDINLGALQTRFQIIF